MWRRYTNRLPLPLHRSTFAEFVQPASVRLRLERPSGGGILEEGELASSPPPRVVWGRCKLSHTVSVDDDAARLVGVDLFVVDDADDDD